MKGRDLIVYILTNHLEDEDVFKDGKIIGFVTDFEAAARLGVGTATVDALFQMGKLPGVKLGQTIYIFAGGLNEKNK